MTNANPHESLPRTWVPPEADPQEPPITIFGQPVTMMKPLPGSAASSESDLRGLAQREAPGPSTADLAGQFAEANATIERLAARIVELDEEVSALADANSWLVTELERGHTSAATKANDAAEVEAFNDGYISGRRDGIDEGIALAERANEAGYRLVPLDDEA